MSGPPSQLVPWWESLTQYLSHGPLGVRLILGLILFFAGMYARGLWWRIKRGWRRKTGPTKELRRC
jgi:hypothetical protein